MRAQQSGHIINISSMGGRLTTYFGAWYHATKYALEARCFTNGSRGIRDRVSIIEQVGLKQRGIIAADKLADSAKAVPMKLLR